MKKLLAILTISALFVIGHALKAEAACTMGAGYLCVVLQDELTASVSGDVNTTVTVIAEGIGGVPADSMASLPNPAWNDVYDGQAGLDADGAADGDIEVEIGPSIAPGGNTPDYTVEVKSTSGYVNVGLQGYTYVAGPEVVLTATLKFTLKITVQDELGSLLNTGTAATLLVASAVDGSCNTTFTDGTITAAGDKDAQNGIIYVKCPVGATSDAIDLTIAKSGYVDEINNTLSISNGAQTTLTTTNDFTLKIAAAGGVQDELGNNITLANANPSTIFSGTTTIVAQRISGNTAYIAASGAGNLTIQQPGYIQKSIAVAPSNASQTIVSYTAGNALPFQIVLNYTNVDDELGGALVYDAGDTFIVCSSAAADWAACVAEGITVTPQTSGTNWYLAPNIAPGAVKVGISKVSGYVNTLDDAAITTAWAGPAVSPDYTGANGLKFPLKVLGIVNELNGALPGGPDAVTFDGNVATAESPAGTYFWADTNGGALSITETGFFSAQKGNTGFTAIATDKTGQTVINFTGTTGLAAVTIGATNNALGLQFPVKTTIKDELDNALITTATVDAGNVYGYPCTEGAAGVYYCPVGNGENANVQASKDGYVTKTKAGAVVDLVGGTQQVNDLTAAAGGNGMPFSHRVTLQREPDGAALTGATVTVGSADTACLPKPATPGDYLCPVVLANDASANDVKVTLDGYVYNNLVTSADRTANGDVQSNDIVNNIRFSYKITSIMTDGNIDIVASATAVDAGDGQGVPCTLLAGAWYCPVPVAHTTLPIKVTKDGYVQDITSLTFDADRTAQADPQETATTGAVKTAYKITALTSDGGVNIFNSGETINVGNAQGTPCVFNVAAWYCPVPLADTTLAIQVTLDGYVQDITSLAFNTDRTLVG
ncbi:MAG: hypothetical protein WCX65_16885, partial [bacterium]